MTKDTSGPAFPQLRNVKGEWQWRDGMTVRQLYFAVCMNGLLSDTRMAGPDELVREASLLAEKMLAFEKQE